MCGRLHVRLDRVTTTVVDPFALQYPPLAEGAGSPCRPCRIGEAHGDADIG